MLQRLSVYLIFLCVLFACGNKKPITKGNQNDSTTIKAYRENPDATTCDPSWSKENTVINHWLNEPATLHPINENASNKALVFGCIHSYLLLIDMRTLELQPDLVKALPTISADGLTYEFELKDGITWDDGSPITAEDVVFTYKANICGLINNAFAKPYVESLLNVEPISGSATKFKFILGKKYILNEYMATYFPILQRKLFDPSNILSKYSMDELRNVELVSVKTDLTSWAENMNGPMYGSEVAKISGAGPYKLESWNVGQTMVLVKKSNHWSAKQDPSFLQFTAYPDKIIFKVADENAAKIETNNQTIDVSTVLSTKALLELEQNPDFVKNYHYGFLPSYNSTYLIMNNKPDGVNHKKLFDDKKVRQAMAYLTPVQNVIDIVYNGKADRLVGPMHAQKKGFNKTLTPIPFDLVKGNALLDEAGWKDSDKDGIRDKTIDGKKIQFEFKLMYPTNSPVAKDIADLVIEQYAKAGLKVIADGLPMDQLVPKASMHDYDMTFFAYGQSALPDDFEQLWGTKSWSSNGSNLCGFGNSQSDALIDSIKTELDWNKRIPMLERFQKMVHDDQPVIFFMASNRKIIIHKRFGNATMYYEKPGVMLNNLKLLCKPGNGTSNVQ
jgi:peptide/nickel transport system substrate-binding protein